MSNQIPDRVELVRITPSGTRESVGNLVALTDENGNPYGPLNPLPVSSSSSSTVTLKPSGTEQNLAVSGTAVSFTPFSAPVVAVIIQVQLSPVRLTVDGNDATGSTGMLLPGGTTLSLSLETTNAASFIQDTEADGVVYAQGYEVV